MPNGNFATGQVAVITGATAGVGRAIALRFARSGAHIGLIARNARALEQVAEEIRGLGVKACGISADVSNAHAIFDAADEMTRALGPLDIWINNAMVTVFSPLAGMSPEEFRRVTEVTYLGYVHGTMAALRHMRPRNRGTIVQVGSALAYRGIPLQSAYCGAKHAILGFTDSLRAELIHEQSAIRLVVVQLPAVNTPQFDWARTHLGHEPRPVAPVFDPETIATAIFRAAGRGERESWVGSSTAKVIFGSMVAPGFLDRFLARTAYTGQQTSKPIAPDRQDNLFEPVADLHRTYGPFAEETRDKPFAVSGRNARIGLGVAGGATVAMIVAAGITLF